MKVLGLFLSVLAICTGCSFQARQQCRSWQREGDFYGTIDSCTKCVENLGSANKEAVKGCALGLDAANLIGGP